MTNQEFQWAKGPPSTRRLERMNDTAVVTALMELVRIAIGQACHRPDPDETRKNLAKVEEAVTRGILSRNLWSDGYADEVTYVQEAATGYASRLLASILPAENGEHGKRGDG